MQKEDYLLECLKLAASINALSDERQIVPIEPDKIIIMARVFSRFLNDEADTAQIDEFFEPTSYYVHDDRLIIKADRKCMVLSKSMLVRLESGAFIEIAPGAAIERFVEKM